MFTAYFVGQEGLYKRKQYKLRIGMINGHIVVNRSCGAGRIYYNSIIEFLKDWNNINRV
jgi:hypothetical protein